MGTGKEEKIKSLKFHGPVYHVRSRGLNLRFHRRSIEISRRQKKDGHQEGQYGPRSTRQSEEDLPSRIHCLLSKQVIELIYACFNYSDVLPAEQNSFLGRCDGVLRLYQEERMKATGALIHEDSERHALDMALAR